MARRGGRLLTPAELVEKFAVLKRGSKNAVREGLTDAAIHVEGVAKDYCTIGKSPYDWMIFPTKVDRHGNQRPGAPYDVGDLRSSITHQVTVSARQVEAAIGSNLDYAAAVHEGHTIPYGTPTAQALAKFGGGSVGFVPGRPFVLDAILDSRDDTIDYIERRLREAIGEVITREAI
jgi:phage gpG-like protein